MRRLVMLVMLLIFGTAVWAIPNRQANLFQLFILQARQDLELLANEQLGEGVRPDGWTFNTDLESPTIVVDLWFDNELLAEQIYGANTRPPDWFGATSGNQELLARNVRHDLEVAADTVFGERIRPPGWNGAPPIYRCDRTIQNLVRLLDEIYNTQPDTADNVFNYCEALRQEIENDLVNIIFSAPGTGTPADSAQLPQQVLAVRGDLERLADEVLGLSTRPIGWTWSQGDDENSPTLADDLNADLNNLADTQIGRDQRPPGWVFFVPDSLAAAYRNLRFNLELLADTLLGEDVRPFGWQGEDPLNRCEPATQALTFIAQINYGFTIDETLQNASDFCNIVDFTVNSLTENPPQPTEEDIEDAADREFSAESLNAFSYLDVGATQYMGIMPRGTEFRAWYRNYGESNMMFVTGDGFGLYVDRRWTTLDPDIYARLPTLEGVRPLTFCETLWCNGPGPTPTPTNDGPLVALLRGDGTTPVAPPPSADQIREEGRTQVSWNHIRVTYLLDRVDLGVVQVALEICAEPAQISCEPVVRVFDNNLGVNKPVISQFQGLNVYEMPYGYSSSFVIEGVNYVSPDIWISDPTIR
ncbi:MAG: hypothetical protein CUN56_13205 [Phototrophicales bacterium]|nr:MAG: hypothetical protein CUN56_13205 [Phototrophicales bacterium]